MIDWKEGLTRYQLVEALDEYFYRDLESWFNSSTFYCDSCVDEFIRQWPGIYSWDKDFQRNAIPLDVFYEGSRFQSEFTKEEFFDLFKEICCPNCGEDSFSNIWPYDLNFDIPPNFEKHVDEIASIAQKTPFVLLSHPFSKKVYNEILKLSRKDINSELNPRLFRARIYHEGKKYTEKDFLAPYKKDIKEGRYNHTGRQVLYLAEDESTCFHEMRSPEEGVMLAEIGLPTNLKILDLLNEEFEDNNIIQAIKFSSLLSSTDEGEGWYKPHYVFTRFVADMAISVGYDAIRYPSVRLNQGCNIVVLNYEKVKDKIKILDFKHFTDNMLTPIGY